jgi:hypothetical protein
MNDDQQEDAFAYINSMMDRRSLMVAPEDAAGTLISMEAQNQGDDDITSYIENNFKEFLEYLKFIRGIDRHLLLSYYLCGVTQARLGPIYGYTQTVTSTRLRNAVKLLTAFMVWEGEPSDILVRLSCDERKIADWTIEFRGNGGHLDVVAKKFKVHRPELRRELARAVDEMQLASEQDTQLMAAYVNMLMLDGKSRITGEETEHTKSRRTETIYRHDPDCLGQFCVSISDDPDWDSLFVPRNEHHAGGVDDGE